MDLTQLKIDRAGPAAGPRKKKHGWPIGWLVLLLLVAVAMVIFWKPLSRAVDGLRLPKVTTVQALRSSPLP